MSRCVQKTTSADMARQMPGVSNPNSKAAVQACPAQDTPKSVCTPYRSQSLDEQVCPENHFG